MTLAVYGFYLAGVGTVMCAIVISSLLLMQVRHETQDNRETHSTSNSQPDVFAAPGQVWWQLMSGVLYLRRLAPAVTSGFHGLLHILLTSRPAL